jgi:hypothetical protein
VYGDALRSSDSQADVDISAMLAYRHYEMAWWMVTMAMWDLVPGPGHKRSERPVGSGSGDGAVVMLTGSGD